MQLFSMRDIENLTGIKAHTIRIWEQRYRLMSPARKPGNHRLYNNDDLKFLLKIATLYHRGHKISEISNYSIDQLDKKILETQAVDGAYNVYINQLFESTLDFDTARFERIVNAAIEQYGFEQSVQNILFPLLIKIGLLWMTNHVIPAQEHFASHIILQKISSAIKIIKSSDYQSGIHVALFTPPEEFHELPVLMVHYLLKHWRIRSTYFGSNVSIEPLKSYCIENGVTHLYTHVLTHLQRMDPDEYLAELSSAFPQQKIVVSGPVFAHMKRNFLNVHVIEGNLYMREYLQYLQNAVHS